MARSPNTAAPGGAPASKVRAGASRNAGKGGAPRRPLFTRISQEVSRYAGKPITFITACAIIVIWGATGPLFGFNDTWQLIINTSTTIVTFLMVFLIQNSQNRDTAALQIKLDELIARLEGPREVVLDLENLDEEDLEELRKEFLAMAEEARRRSDEGASAEQRGPTAAQGDGHGEERERTAPRAKGLGKSSSRPRAPRRP